MATATLGQLDKGVKLSVKDGQVVGASQVALVEDITASTLEEWGDEVLAATGLPSYGSTVSISGYTLKVKDFDIDVLPGDMTKAYVAIKYNRDTHGGSPIDQGSPTLRISGGLRQLQTSKDVNGTDVTVTHNGEEQSIIYDWEESTLTIAFSKIVVEQFIFTHVDSFHNVLNDGVWAGKERGTWRMTVTDTEILNELDRQYRVSYQFEYNESGWNPTVYFTDTTGSPPVGLVEGTGFKEVERYEYVDFNSILPTREVSP